MPKPFSYCPYCASPLEMRFVFGEHRLACPTGDYVHFVDPKVAVCAFVVREGQVLLVKRGVDPEKGKWALPAGYVNYGEDPQAATIREVEEETGLVVTITALQDVMYYAEDNAVIVIIYDAVPNGGTLQAGDDAEEADWFAADALPEIAFESTRVTLARWLGLAGDDNLIDAEG